MYTVEIYMETDENMILQVPTFQKKNIASALLFPFTEKAARPLPGRAKKAAFP
jgi:hypothetical protein